MDAVKYLKELDRMCKKYTLCADCPIYRQTKKNCGLAYSNAAMLAGNVKIVEQWAKENPVETRKSKCKRVCGWNNRYMSALHGQNTGVQSIGRRGNGMYRMRTRVLGNGGVIWKN